MSIHQPLIIPTFISRSSESKASSENSSDSDTHLPPRPSEGGRVDGHSSATDNPPPLPPRPSERGRVDEHSSDSDDTVIYDSEFRCSPWYYFGDDRDPFSYTTHDPYRLSNVTDLNAIDQQAAEDKEWLREQVTNTSRCRLNRLMPFVMYRIVFVVLKLMFSQKN